MAARRPARARFPRSTRLLGAGDYRRVFAGARRISDRYFTLLARENGLAHARLGLAISRKAAPRAVDRNRLKRIVRETFRVRLAELPPMDIVVTARADARKLDNQRLREVLGRLWLQLAD